jgi:hypothetical protein
MMKTSRRKIAIWTRTIAKNQGKPSPAFIISPLAPRPSAPLTSHYPEVARTPDPTETGERQPKPSPADVQVPIRNR